MRTISGLLLFLCLSRLMAADLTTAVEAKALITKSRAQMIESDTKPERIVDAALGFASALTWYEKQSDIDVICDLEASLFWCRKRMSAEMLTAYVAKKGGTDNGAKESLAKVEQVAEKTVDATEAQTYLNRADAFAQANPDQLYQISIRYYEVAERFQGTPISLSAQRQSLDAQQRWARTIVAKAGKAAATPEPASEPALAKTAAHSAPPDVDTLKTATATIKDLYKAEYATAKSRARLVTTLTDQAAASDQDALSRYALLNEARELAIATRNVMAVITLSEQLAAAYSGPDSAAHLRQQLPRVTGHTAIPALLKLLDAPDDALSCGIAGRWYAVDEEEWERALPLLAKGSDPLLDKAATLELAAHTKPAEQIAIGDQWYDIGKRAGLAKEAFWRHALTWYEQAATGLTGISAAIAHKRIAEIEEFLPLGPDADYTKLSAGQWEKIKGRTIVVDANRGPLNTGITLSAGQPMRVVPHPTDTWTVIEGRGALATKTTWKGAAMRGRANGALRCQVGGMKDQTPGIVTGTGPLVLFADAPKGRFASITGTIRVKVLPVTGD